MPKAKSKKSIVVIGGGTGTSVVLEGLKKYPVNLSAIITTADDGSSSGKLRKEFDMIPPGDIRQCLVALASRDFGYLNERFQQGSLAGHTLGNLLITLFYQKNKNFQQAIDELLLITGAQGSLIPMTLKPATLIAKLKDGRILQGEKNITPSREIREKLHRLSLRPADIEANPRAISAINNADIIVVGPGNLFSSILPNFLVKGIRDAVIAARAKKIYISNLFTQPGHTDGFTPLDFVDVMNKHIGSGIFEHIIYNNRPISEEVFKKHANLIIKERVTVPGFVKSDKRFVGRSIASNVPRVASASDPIAQIRNPFLHDSKKLAKAIIELCK
jgi:uncharacterized cofD-like protein